MREQMRLSVRRVRLKKAEQIQLPPGARLYEARYGNTRILREYAYDSGYVRTRARKLIDERQKMRSKEGEMTKTAVNTGYVWLVHQDWTETNDYETAQGKTLNSDDDAGNPDRLNDPITVNVIGPRGFTGDLPPASEGQHFRLYDDDGNLYYEGVLWGDFDGFEPMDDYGFPNAGCTTVKLHNPETFAWEAL